MSIFQSQYGDFNQLNFEKNSFQVPSHFQKPVQHRYHEFSGIPPHEAESLYLEAAQGIDLYGVYLFSVADANRQVDIGVSFSGIVFYDSNLPKSSNELEILSNQEGWSRMSNGANFIPWYRIQKLKYRDKEFIIEYTTKSKETIKKILKLSHFRQSKTLYLTCIEHHDLYKSRKDCVGRKDKVFRPSEEQQTLSPNTALSKIKPNQRGRGFATNSTDSLASIIPGPDFSRHLQYLPNPMERKASSKVQDFGEKNGLNYEQIAIPSGPKHPDCFNDFGFTCSIARNGALVVEQIFDGTPAQKSSLKIHHEIIQINSVDIRDYDVDMIERHIKSAQNLGKFLIYFYMTVKNKIIFRWREYNAFMLKI